MLAQRATWLSAAPTALLFTSRHRLLLISNLSPFSRYTTHSPARPSAELKNSIIEEARLLQQQEKSIPWYRLAAKYHLAIDALQGIFNQAEADAQRRQQQSVLVARAAEDHFDSALGQCDWEAVSRELGIPLIECLDLFGASSSTIQPRSLIEAYGGWSTADLERLKRFIATTYADDSAIDWRLAGAFMNVHPLECQRVGLGTFKAPINEVGYRRISELRKSKLSWKEIHQYFQQYLNEIILSNGYHWFKAKLGGKTHDELTAPWTDAERKLMKDLMRRHLESTTRSELADIIQRELPARPRSEICLLCYRYVTRLKTSHLTESQMIRLRELVVEHGEDWNRIGEALGVLPSRARYNWIEFGGDAGSCSAWTADEIRQLRRLTNSGVGPKEAARLLGIKPYRIYKRKSATTSASPPSQKDGSFLKINWAAADDETLLKMANEHAADTTAKWEQISKTLGRTMAACKDRARHLRYNRKLEQVSDDRKSMVTSEVQRQFESSGSVDWSLVSQATGLSMRECLEHNLYGVGKARWRYDSDTFLQSMADQMTRFISEHYPAPIPVNYQAVSNFMWVVMGDCIHIHEMLQGKFRWTEGDYKQAAALRAQGLTFKEVAWRLSPMLSAQNLKAALRRHSFPKRAKEPVSAYELEEIPRLVDRYAGKHPVIGIIAQIRAQLNLGGRLGYHNTIASRIAAHPHYLAKMGDVDYNDLANRIVKGQTTVALAAKELDVPRLALVARMNRIDGELYSPKWTDEEIRKLTDYVQSCDSKPDFFFISKIIGTKSKTQCWHKVNRLRLKGVLSPTK